MTRTIVSLVAALALAACGSDSPTATQTPGGDRSLVGTYVLTEVQGEPIPAIHQIDLYTGGEFAIRRDDTAEVSVHYIATVGEGVTADRHIRFGGSFRLTGTTQSGTQMFVVESSSGVSLSGQVIHEDAVLLYIDTTRLRFERGR